MGIEDRLERSLDAARERRLELSPVMKTAYEKALTVSKNPAYAIQMEDFESAYRGEVKSDLRTVERLEKEQAAQNTPQQEIAKRIAEVMEAIVLSEAELSNWLGDASTIKASKYDDLVNGIDMFAEFRPSAEGTSTLALAVDVTFGTQTARKKLEDIKQQIRSGVLSEAKYYQDSDGDFMGMRKNIPRVVIGVSQATVEELAGLWVNGKKRELGAHPVQRAFLEEIYAQLRAMYDYAKSVGNETTARAYVPAMGIVRKLLEEKRAAFTYGTIAEDPVFQDIMDQTVRVFGK